MGEAAGGLTEVGTTRALRCAAVLAVLRMRVSASRGPVPFLRAVLTFISRSIALGSCLPDALFDSDFRADGPDLR